MNWILSRGERTQHHKRSKWAEHKMQKNKKNEFSVTVCWCVPVHSDGDAINCNRLNWIYCGCCTHALWMKRINKSKHAAPVCANWYPMEDERVREWESISVENRWLNEKKILEKRKVRRRTDFFFGRFKLIFYASVRSWAFVVVKSDDFHESRADALLSAWPWALNRVYAEHVPNEWYAIESELLFMLIVKWIKMMKRRKAMMQYRIHTV